MESKLSNDRLIGAHRKKLDYVPSPADTLQFSYGDRRYEKMTSETYYQSDILKIKTLKEINEDLRRSDFTNLMILSSDFISVIVSHFTHQDDEIRELASRAMSEICNTELGRKNVIENAIIHDILTLIDDEQIQIRANSYQSMLNLTLFLEGQDHFLLAEAQIALVDKLVNEKDEDILIMVLQLIKAILNGEGGTEQFLSTEIIERLKNLIDHSNDKIRELAIVNLAQMSFLNIGKHKEIEQKCVIAICKRLEDRNSNVREVVTLALASLAQRNEAKEQILQFGYFSKIMELLGDPSEQTRLNIIQLISSVSEDPQGRKKAQNCLDQLNNMLQDHNCEFLHPYIEQTKEVIKWKP